MPRDEREAVPAVLAELLPQVKANSTRADAAVAGLFSLCGLLLRLRNLYKWEHGLPPWREEEPAKVLDWVSQREEDWLALEETDPLPLMLDGAEIDPFDTGEVNRRLEPQGLVYGAGRVGGMLPVFFLGRVARRIPHNGLTILELDREFTEDIFFLPGLLQEDTVYLRPRPLAYLLWDKLMDPRKSLKRFVEYGIRGYGLDPAEFLARPDAASLDHMVAGELEGVMFHEMGEAADSAPARDLLHWAASEHPGSELEHFVRGVKDILADTGPTGRLASLAAHRRKGALGLYPAWLAGFPRLLFPEIDAAVMVFMDSGEWEVLEEARELAWERANRAVDLLRQLRGRDAGEETARLARNEIIGPLTGFRSVSEEE